MSNRASSHQFEQWLRHLPPESLERLRTINLSTGSSRHIILALAFGLYDANIFKVNRMITGLLLLRMRAERDRRFKLVMRINNFMDGMHKSIDVATGCVDSRPDQHSVCGRAPMQNLTTSGSIAS